MGLSISLGGIDPRSALRQRLVGVFGVYRRRARVGPARGKIRTQAHEFEERRDQFIVLADAMRTDEFPDDHGLARARHSGTQVPKRHRQGLAETKLVQEVRNDQPAVDQGQTEEQERDRGQDAVEPGVAISMAKPDAGEDPTYSARRFPEASERRCQDERASRLHVVPKMR